LDLLKEDSRCSPPGDQRQAAEEVEMGVILLRGLVEVKRQVLLIQFRHCELTDGSRLLANSQEQPWQQCQGKTCLD
jgi:hypothetical protein